jgi:hypothetical protein
VKITDLNSNTRILFYFILFFFRTEHMKLIRMKKGVADPNARTLKKKKKKKGKEKGQIRRINKT